MAQPSKTFAPVQTWWFEGFSVLKFSPSGKQLAGLGNELLIVTPRLFLLHETGVVADLTVQQKIESGLMEEKACLSSNQIEELSGCAKYFLQKGFDSKNTESLRTALRLAKKATQLDPAGEGPVIVADCRRLLRKMDPDFKE